MLEAINVWAVLLAAIASMVIGSIWYSKYLFGNQWMRLHGMNPTKAPTTFPAKEMLLQFVVSFVTAFFVAEFSLWVGAYSVVGVQVLVVWIWLGFLVTTLMGPSLWERKPWTLYFMSITQLFVSLLAMATIIGLWR